MKKLTVLIGMLFSLMLQAQKLEVIDEIIGVAGGEILLKSELETSALEVTKGKGGLGKDQYCSLFENLLFQKLLLNQSKLDSLEVSDAEVQGQVQRRLDYFVQMFGSVEEFEKNYGKSTAQLKDEYFDLIKDQILVQRMQEEITKNVRVTPSDVKRYFVAVPKDSLPLINEQVQYSQIVIDPEIKEGQKQATINFLDSIRTRLTKGQSIMAIEAAKWSEDPGSSAKGGCYPLQRKGSFVPEYEAAVFNTPEGGYSPVFESTYGYHFVKVLEIRGEFYESCHILMSPKVSAADLDKARMQLDSVMAVLRADTVTFALAAQRYSTDVGTKNQGGRVMNSYNGGTKHDVSSLSAELNLTMMSLEVGEISEPVMMTGEDGQQQYVIYRLDNRIPAHVANIKEDYDIFESVAREKANQEEVEKWMRKKLASTFVQINDDYKDCVFEFPWVTSK
jgi:peptidyl-prolyl cis-trans isomerase SurA